jgi:purine-binding chemotaxis protein CheW
VAEENQYCTFFVAGHCFGVDVSQVQEIIRHQEMTRVPLAPAAIRGLINLRGQIVTAIDLRRRLGFADRPAEQSHVNVVIQTDDGPVSLLVDEVGEVLEVSEKLFEAPPSTLSGAARQLIRGAYKLDSHLLLLLDVEQALQAEVAE